MADEYESRRGAARAEDIDRYIPDSATQAFSASDTEGVWTDDGTMYVTGVQCTRCHCSVAVHDEVVWCPNCGWRSDGGHVDPDEITWEERTEHLQNSGVPKRRAEIVALVEKSETTHADVADELDLNNRATVGTTLAHYRDRDVPDNQWLREFGPDV